MSLEELAAKHKQEDARRRARGLLSLDKGYRVTVVAEILGVSTQRIRNWAVWWNERGVAGLVGGHKGGRPAKLIAEMLATGKQLALAQPMTVIGFLDRLAARTDPTRFSIVVLDNASVHHAIPQDKLDQWLLEHRLIL